MPGVECGDLGPKFGFHSKDNGFLRLDKVRIPRRQMLMKYAKVNKEGEFSFEGDVRFLYSAMMEIRIFLVMSASMTLNKVLKKVARYACVRR